MSKTLSITEIEQQGDREPIWVVNSSGDAAATRYSDGDVRIMIPKVNASGDPDPLIVPATWLPVCITEQVPRFQLLATSSLRHAWRAGLIQFITAEQAKRILGREGAQEEQQRLDDAAEKARSAGVSKTLDQTPVDILNADGRRDDSDDEPHHNMSTDVDADTYKNKVDEAAPGISPAFSAWVAKHKNETDIGVLNALRVRKRFTTAEMRYMAKAFSDKPKTLAAIRAKLGK